MDYSKLSASDNTGEAVVANIESTRAPAATTLDVDNVDNWPTNFICVTGTLNPNNYIDNSSMTIFYGHLDAGNIIIDSFAPGYTDVGNTAGQIAIIKPTTEWVNKVVALARVEHQDDGTHGDITPTSVSSTGAVKHNGVDLSFQEIFHNAIINSGCEIAQRTAPNLSTTSQYGATDRFRVHATGTLVSAGTIANTTSPAVVTNGQALKITSATITGTGIVYVRYRMEAKDAMKFVSAATSFSVLVRHDVGSSINATIYIRKPTTTADVFSATTDIANSGAISVPNTTATLIKFENINSGNIGDVSKGIEIEIQFACGAITTKNFELTQFQFNKGATAAPWQPRLAADEANRCYRYYETFGYGNQACIGSAADMKMLWPYRVTKRTTPTVTLLTTTPNMEETNIAARTGAGSTLVSPLTTQEGATGNVGGFSGMTAGRFAHATADRILASDAEL